MGNVTSLYFYFYLEIFNSLIINILVLPLLESVKEKERKKMVFMPDFLSHNKICKRKSINRITFKFDIWAILKFHLHMLSQCKKKKIQL